MQRTATLITLLALILLTQTACVVIEDGEVGVSKSFGKIGDEPLPQGVTMVVPIARQVEVWNVKLQELKERADVPSSEGLIVSLDTSLLFKVRPDDAPNLRKTIGTQRQYIEKLVVPYFRNAVRDVVAGFPVKNIYAETGRRQIAAKIKGFLEENLGSRGIEVVDVLLRDVQLPQRFKESIEAKLTAEQKAEQKKFELAQATKDAEIEVARARGAAEAQKIINTTLTSGYLQYLWIQTLNQNPNVIYVATEANLPIFKSVGGIK